jgi:hypothetical protein
LTHGDVTRNGDCLRAGARRECASTKKFTGNRERVFFIRSQALEATSKNGLTYDGCVSGSIIYAYVGGNPVDQADPSGLGDCIPEEKPLENVCPECYLFGVGRLLYAGLMRTIPFIARATPEAPWGQAAYANAARNSMKDLFRGPLAKPLEGWHQPSFAQTAARYGYEPEEMISAAGRTNVQVNIAGAGAVLMGAAVGNAPLPVCGH